MLIIKCTFLKLSIVSFVAKSGIIVAFVLYMISGFLLGSKLFKNSVCLLVKSGSPPRKRTFSISFGMLVILLTSINPFFEKPYNFFSLAIHLVENSELQPSHIKLQMLSNPISRNLSLTSSKLYSSLNSCLKLL